MVVTTLDSQDANNRHSTERVNRYRGKCKVLSISSVMLSPSRKARHCGVVGVSSRVVPSISDDPHLKNILALTDYDIQQKFYMHVPLCLQHKSGRVCTSSTTPRIHCSTNYVNIAMVILH